MNVESLLQDVRAQFGHDGIERVEECLWVLAGKKSPRYLHPDQEANRIFFPGISAKPWHDTTVLPWVRKVESQWKDVRAEFLSLVDQNVTFYPYEDQYTRDIGWPGWNTWHLYRKGHPTERALESCPKTLACLASSPHGLREGLYSILNPGTHLEPHSGGANLVLTAHLPLLIPDDCALRVGDETRKWTEGQMFLFDDSFIHEAWNRSDSRRVILLWDVWHPDLTPLEIQVLSYLFPHLDEFFTAH